MQETKQHFFPVWLFRAVRTFRMERAAYGVMSGGLGLALCWAIHLVWRSCTIKINVVWLLGEATGCSRRHFRATGTLGGATWHVQPSDTDSFLWVKPGVSCSSPGRSRWS